MPTPYKGRVEIKCDFLICKVEAVKENIDKQCFDCEWSQFNIIDFEDKKVGTLKKKMKKKEVNEDGI